MAILKIFVDVPLDPKDTDPEEHAQYIIDTVNEEHIHTMCDGVVLDMVSAEWVDG